MTDPDRNAAIWYKDDGYRPDKNGINGRRVAGASFLKGFFSHADVSEFVSLTTGSQSADSFADLLKEHGRDLPARAAFEEKPQQMNTVGTVYFPAPTMRICCGSGRRSGWTPIRFAALPTPRPPKR